MNKLEVEISPVDTDYMEDMETPHFVLGLAGERPVSETKNCFSRLLQSCPRVPSTLQLSAAKNIVNQLFCLFSVHQLSPSLSLVYVGC